jgi:tetratricopeptide (TPR) repeat protein
MKMITSFRILRPWAVYVAALLIVACGQQDQPVVEVDTGAVAEPPAKVSITTASDEARELYLQGRALLDNLQLAEANEVFVQAVQADDGFAMGYFMLAQTSQSAADFFDAIAKAGELSGGVSDGEQLYIAALVAASKNDQAGQLETLKQLVATYPQDERTHAQLANFLNGQQDFSGAIEHYGHAVSINPDFASGYNSLGYAYRSLEDFENAKAAFAKYVALIPDEANPYDSYAELLMEMGDYDESIENYRKALEIDPGFAASYAGISINQSLKGEAGLAQEAADQMLATASNFAQRQGAMFRSVTSHLFAGNTDAAMAVCATMLAEGETEGNHAAMGGVSEYMGDIMLAAGEAAMAEEHYNAALDHRLEAGFNEANQAQAKRTHLFKTAIASMVGDDPESAASRTAEYNTVAEMSGTAFERRRIHELSAYLAMDSEENEAAAGHFAQASQLDPIVLYWSAVTYAELGNTEQAIDLATRAANRNTLSPNLPFFRGEAQELVAKLTAE